MLFEKKSFLKVKRFQKEHPQNGRNIVHKIVSVDQIFWIFKIQKILRSFLEKSGMIPFVIV